MRVAILALLGTIFALVPAMPAQAANEAVTVTNPAKSQTWVAGTTKTITWQTDLTAPDTVQIDLMAVDGVTVAAPIAASVSAAVEKFNWQIPLTSTASTFRIRVQGNEEPTATDVSRGLLTIALPDITAVAPKTGDTWTAGKVNPIRWTTNTTGNIKLELVQGATVTSIRPSIAATAKSFNWGVPVSVATASGGLFKVRLTSLANPSITEESQDFTINLPVVGVSAPALNDDWGTGTTQTIKWSLPSTGNVKVELITQPGSTATATLKASQAAKSGTLKWVVPHAQVLGDYTVRVTSLVNANLFDDSGVFQVVQGALTVTSPTGADTWLAGTSKRITWTTAIGGSVKLELVGASTVTIRPSVAASARSFTWSIPLNVATAGGTYVVRATSLTNALTTDDSPSFTLNLPGITANTPTATEAGTKKEITWSTTMTTGNVKIEAITQPGATATTTIKSSQVAKSGKFLWTVPATLAESDYKIRITSLNNGQIWDESGDFAVTWPVITTGTPGGAWTAGTSQPVTWSTTITGNVKLELITPGGTKVIRSSVAASAGTFNWAIPINVATASGQSVTIRVTSLLNAAVTDSSNAFTLNLPTLTVAALPAQISRGGGPHTITWAGLTTGSVKIELVFGGNVVSTIRSSVGASVGTFAWTIPPATTLQAAYTVRVTSLSNAGITDEGDPFEIIV